MHHALNVNNQKIIPHGNLSKNCLKSRFFFFGNSSLQIFSKGILTHSLLPSPQPFLQVQDLANDGKSGGKQCLLTQIFIINDDKPLLLFQVLVAKQLNVCNTCVH